MVATQRVEGLFSVAKTAGVDKRLSLCALWERLRRVNRMLDVEHGRRVSLEISCYVFRVVGCFVEIETVDLRPQQWCVGTHCMGNGGRQ